MLLFFGIAVASILLFIVIGASATSIARKRRLNKALTIGLAKYKDLVESWVKEVEETSSDTELWTLASKRPSIKDIFYRQDRWRQLRSAAKYPAEKMWGPARHQHALQKVKVAKERLEAPERAAQQTYEKAKKAPDPRGELEILFELLSTRSEVLAGISLTKAQIRLWIKKSYLKVLKEARAGDRNAFLQLRAFFANSQEYHKRAPIKGRPKDWSELVIRYLDNPDLSDFKEGHRWYSSDMPQTGELRLMAAEALRTESLLQCQEVLAYCNYNAGFREEVGDRLVAELAKLVDRLQAKARAKEVTS